MTNTSIVRAEGNAPAALAGSASSMSLSLVPRGAQGLLLRMFANPQVLEQEERKELVAQLRECVAKNPEVAELRVVYGMALCVNLDVQQAMEELGQAVSLAPDNYLAHLKMGELWMRLRVCAKAQDHTHQAERLAQNFAQAELARRQAATIRTMMREGVERGGYKWAPWFSLARLRRLWNRGRNGALAPVESQ